jgi:hypothetical protein
MGDRGFGDSLRFGPDVSGNGMADLVAFGNSDIKVAVSGNLPPPPPPAAPSNLDITGKTSTSLTIAWKDNSNDERRFFVSYWKGCPYTARIKALERYGGVPPFRETREYLRRVLEYHRRYHTDGTSSIRGQAQR